MRTYLLDILNRYNRLSESLDVKTILCNKSWLIFNDTGDKELYIFQENGSLIASVNGEVINATWQYVPANKSIILSFKGQSYMLHPSFLDKNIFALQQDGTNRYAFMIDEKQSQSFQPKSLTELKSYFENIERKRIEEEQHRKKLWAEQQKEIEQRKIEEEHRERIKKQQEEIQQYKNKKRLEYWEYYQKSILTSDSVFLHLCAYKGKWERRRIITILVFIFGVILGMIYNDGLESVGSILSLILIVASVIFFIINGFFSDYPSENIKEYKKKIKDKILNGDFDNQIYFDKHKLKENNSNEDVVKEAFESLNHLVNQLKQNKDAVKENCKNKDVENAFESVDDFETRIKKEKQEEENRKREEEKRKKDEEWEEYQKRRDKEDFERIERHRIEREKKEKGLNILREEENIKKKEQGKEEQELKQKELREKEERRKWLNEEAFNIQCKLNGNKHVREVAKKISLRVEYLSVQPQKHGLTFKVHWICPSDCTCKEISLIINNGDDVLLYEHLATFGSQIIELNEVKSIIRITLRFTWLNMPVYKIILIDKE